MINNINGYNGTAKSTADTSRQLEQSKQVSQENQLNKATETRSQSGDRVELSQSARLMKSTEEGIKKMPDVDQDKVDRIKSAIRNGEYTINHESLAAAIEAIESEI